jgi:hypothetical protein
VFARRPIHRRVALAGALLCLAGLVGPATAGSPASTAGAPSTDKVEVWRLHPSAAARHEADFQLTLNWVGSGDRGALMIVDDEHTDHNAAVGFAGAELADTNYRPEVYDHERGIDYTDCQEPVVGRCSWYLSGASLSDSYTWDYQAPILNGKPDPSYAWPDIYVGAVNARITRIGLTGARWTVTRATNATMVLIENQDTAHGAGAHVANYTVEHFDGAQLAVPKGAWAAVSVRLPCPSWLIGMPTPQDDGKVTGYTLPDDGRPYIPLSCRHLAPWADVFATGPTTVRLTVTSSAPMAADDWTAAQNLDRLVALVVTPPKPRPRH